MICSPKTGFTRFSSVAASKGRNLYMKMKKPMEKMIFTAASQPLISNFLPCSSGGIWSSATFAEKRNARNPRVIAWPRVITPRTMGHPIHLCFSEGRSRFSLWVAISPEGLRTAMAQAWGERIITPSSTAWPPTKVSAPPSSAGNSWTAMRKRQILRKEHMILRWCFRKEVTKSKSITGESEPGALSIPSALFRSLIVLSDL